MAGLVVTSVMARFLVRGAPAGPPARRAGP
jgi:hypothetical protein